MHAGFMSERAALLSAILYLAELSHCRYLVVTRRWPGGKVKCSEGGAGEVVYLARQRVWKCYTMHPIPRLSLTHRTVFEDSRIPLEKWLPAVGMLLSVTNGVSAWDLRCAPGATRKTACSILHRSRLAARTKTSNILAGEVAADGGPIGGRAWNMRADGKAEKIYGCGQGGNAMVAAALGRVGIVRVRVCETRRKPELQPPAREGLEAVLNPRGDGQRPHDSLDGFTHQVVDNATAYAEGYVDTEKGARTGKGIRRLQWRLGLKQARNLERSNAPCASCSVRRLLKMPAGELNRVARTAGEVSPRTRNPSAPTRDSKPKGQGRILG